MSVNLIQNGGFEQPISNANWRPMFYPQQSPPNATGINGTIEIDMVSPLTGTRSAKFTFLGVTGITVGMVGYIQYIDNPPAGGYTIRVRYVAPNGARLDVNGWDATANAWTSGSFNDLPATTVPAIFEIPYTIPANTSYIQFSIGAYYDSVYSPIPVGATASFDDVEFVTGALPPTYNMTFGANRTTGNVGDTFTFTGVVTLGATPQSGIPVNLYRNGALVNSATTDATGAYTFSRTESVAGSFTYYAECPSILLTSQTITIIVQEVTPPPVGTNLIQNPDFENAISNQNWRPLFYPQQSPPNATGVNGTIDIDTTTPIQGTRSGRTAFLGVTGVTIGMVGYIQYINNPPAGDYVIQVRYRASNGARLDVGWIDTTGVYVNGIYIDLPATSTPSTYQTNVTIPANIGYIQFMVGVLYDSVYSPIPVGSSATFDEIVMATSTPQPVQTTALETSNPQPFVNESFTLTGTVMLNGVPQANATYSLYRNNALLVQATTNASGQVTFTRVESATGSYTYQGEANGVYSPVLSISVISQPPPPTYYTGETYILASGTYQVNMPASVVVAGVTYTFSHWGDAPTNTNPVRTVTVTSPVVLSVVYQGPPIPVTLTTSVTPSGTGTIAVTPSPPYNKGQTVTATATPASNAEFLRWLLDGVELSTSPSISLTLDADHTLQAVFQIATVLLDTSVSPAGAGTIALNPQPPYVRGQTVNASATPASNAVFLRWLLDGNVYSTSPTVSLTLDANHALQAVFQIIPPLTTEAGGPYSASIRNPLVQFQGSATGGLPPYQWNWAFGDGNTASTQSPPHLYSAVGAYQATLTVMDSRGATAIDTATATISDLLPPLPEFTSTPASPIVGSTVSFDASPTTTREPNTTVILYEWRFGDGQTSAGSTPYATHVYANAGTFPVVLTVTDTLGQKNSITHNVVVGQPPHLLTVTFTNGTVYVYPTSPNGYYPYGTSVDIIASPDNGYFLESFTDNGVTFTPGSKLTVLMEIDHVVAVNFAPIPPQKWVLTVSGTTGGSTSPPAGVFQVDDGASYTVTAIPATNNVFVKWVFDGADFSTELSVVIPAQTAGSSHTLQAVFALVVTGEFPWWLIPVGGVGASAVILATTRGKKKKRRR